jgi:hypothetical protein
LTYKLDPDDLIFPRTASRIGAKFQVTVPPGPEPYNTPIGKYCLMLSKLLANKHPLDIEERGGDNTVEVLGIYNTFTESECRFCLRLNFRDCCLRNRLYVPNLVAEGEVVFHESYGLTDLRNS